MSSDICSKNFKAFYENIERIGLSPDEIAQRVKESLPLIAEDISRQNGMQILCSSYAL